MSGLASKQSKNIPIVTQLSVCLHPGFSALIVIHSQKKRKQRQWETADWSVCLVADGVRLISFMAHSKVYFRKQKCKKIKQEHKKRITYELVFKFWSQFRDRDRSTRKLITISYHKEAQFIPMSMRTPTEVYLRVRVQDHTALEVS